ncbi:MAG: cupin domain-containing protein [Clostridiaceae bacterium]|nr:cupin domain-containing protein [Clostridiaceae bacterium]
MDQNLSESVIFPKGEKITNTYFIGDTWLQMLVSDNIFNCPIGNVTFAPGARNNWHRHPGGQILLVTGGRGYYQEEGKPAQVLRAGDVVRIPPDVKHWHGAAPDSWFVHLAISTNPQKGGAKWLEPVTEEEYKSQNLLGDPAF